MKTTGATLRFFATWLCLVAPGRGADPATAEVATWIGEPRNGHETTWSVVKPIKDENGHVVREEVHSYVQLGSGLNIPQADGSFAAADPSFTLVADEAEARGTIHRVRLPGSLDGLDSVELTMPSGQILRWRIDE